MKPNFITDKTAKQVGEEHLSAAYLMKTIKLALLVTIGVIFGTLNGKAQWVQDNTIEGGIINAFTVSGSNLFAGTSGGGVYISSNNGASWTGVNNGLPDYGLVAALFASGPNILASVGSKLYVTLNNGVSWSEVTSGLPAFSSITSFTNNGTGTFAAGSVGVFLSTDNGINWVSANTGLPGSPSINSIVASGTNLFVAGSGGVYFSGDSGSNWSAVNNTSFASGAPTFNIVKSLAVNGSNLFAGTAKLGVFLSTDNGANWSAVNSGLASNDINALAISGTNLFAGTNDIGSVFTSSNNGATWSAANTGLNPNTIVRAFAINGSNLFAGTWAGVAVSANNGASWTNSNAGLKASAIFALEFIGSNLFAGTAGGIFRSTNNGVSWTPVNSGLSNTNIQCLITNGTSLLAGTVGGGGGVFQSNDNGASWSSINNGILIGTLQDIRSLSADGVNYFAGGGDGRIFRSTDSGGNWAQVFATNTVHGLKAIGSNIFAARQGVRVSRSIDNGSSWSDANSGIVPASGSTYGFAATATELYVAADFGVYLSTNLGLTWTRPGLPGFAPQFLRSVVASGSNVFAGSDFNGIYFSSDKGSNWSTESFPQLRVRALAISGTTVFTGTQGQGIWSRVLSSPPTITSFTPGNGPIGTTVTITGTNFDPTPANNIVYFGATRANVTAATSTQLTVTVPTGATYQPITVQVAGLTAYSSKRFFPTFPGGGSIDACSFARKDFAAGLNPLGMMIKDFDGDGKGDIAITEVFSYQLSIYKNTSTIGVIDASTLSTPVSLATLPINPWSVSSGDIDGDGKPDLVIANSLGYSISIYRNTSTPGTISFEPKVDFAAGVAPWRTVVIDIDGDGKPEIVVSRPEIGLHFLKCKQDEKIRKNHSGTRGYYSGVFAGRYDLS